MQDVTRNSYSLYQRKTGSRVVWYVRFWSDETQTYTSGRSTGQTTRQAANRVVQKWLAEGMPEPRKNNHQASQRQLLSGIAKYLQNTSIIEKGEKYEDDEIVKLFFTQVTNRQMSSAENFVDYLYRFWDWNGDYVKGRLERKKSIGKRYVDDCRAKIQRHIEPFFKGTLLCDVTTETLENFMMSIPRRDSDPKNGYARKTINLIMKTITKPLREATRKGILMKNPANGIELLADDDRERGILTPAELELLFQKDWPDERSKTACILAATTGMRLSEIAGLRTDDIDAERNIINLRFSYTQKEKRLKDTKSGKPRIIFTDVSITTQLLSLHKDNPYENAFIFWGSSSDKPMRIETIENHLEKVLAELLGKITRTSISKEWQDLANELATKTALPSHEIIALKNDDVDTVQNTIRLRHCYSYQNRKLVVSKDVAENTVKMDAPLLKRIKTFTMKNPYIFIFGGPDSITLFDFEGKNDSETKKRILILGEIVRKERNILFHSFRHFFNSTIRGTVSDDILRLQTGHSDKKMTDLYDHMTEDRGEQLRKAVQTKILPFIPKEAAGE
jgi:integrase